MRIIPNAFLPVDVGAWSLLQPTQSFCKAPGPGFQDGEEPTEEKSKAKAAKEWLLAWAFLLAQKGNRLLVTLVENNSQRISSS